MVSDSSFVLIVSRKKPSKRYNNNNNNKNGQLKFRKLFKNSISKRLRGLEMWQTINVFFNWQIIS